MESTERHNGGLGRSPQRGPGTRGRAPKAETLSLWTFNESGKFAHFSEIWKRRKPNHRYLFSPKGEGAPHYARINTPLSEGKVRTVYCIPVHSLQRYEPMCQGRMITDLYIYIGFCKGMCPIHLIKGAPEVKRRS